jgi:stage II sporulation protein AA (anti-sigma F factor antagonist)
MLKSAPVPDDDAVLETARKLGLLSAPQVEEIRRLRREDLSLPLADVLLRGGTLTADQLRAVLVAARYEQTREEDLALAAFIVTNGFVSDARVQECLAAQEGPYARGEDFPRLQTLLIDRGHLSAQQMQMIVAARTQIETTRRQLMATGASIPTKPKTRRMQVPEAASFEVSSEPEAKEAEFTPLQTPAPPPPPADARPGVSKKTLIRPRLQLEDEFLKKHKDAAVLGEHLKVAVRRTKLKDARGEVAVAIVDIVGSVDGQSARAFELWLSGLIESGSTNLVLNGEKLAGLDSPAAGVLPAAVKRVRDRGGDLRLCSVSDAVRKVVNGSGLDQLMRVYDNERGAVMSFKYM